MIGKIRERLFPSEKVVSIDDDTAVVQFSIPEINEFVKVEVDLTDIGVEEESDRTYRTAVLGLGTDETYAVNEKCHICNSSMTTYMDSVKIYRFFSFREKVKLYCKNCADDLEDHALSVLEETNSDTLAVHMV